MAPAGKTASGARRRLKIGALIFLVVAASVVATAGDPGVTWDEGIYYGFAAGYFNFLKDFSYESLSEETLTRYWWNGQVHPPLGKLWIAANFVVFAGGLAVDLVSAARMGVAAVFGLTALVLFLWIAERRGDTIGLIAALAFVLMPRLFAHGHFANLEMLTVLLWLGTTIAFERGVHRHGWSVACGALFGLALLTKVNAVFLPFVLGTWGLLFHGRKALRNLVYMACLGPLLFLVGWPALWHHPIERTVAYFGDKAKRSVIPVYYFGRVYGDPAAPFHYPFVMLLATTPLLVLVPAGYAVVRFAKQFRAGWRDAPRGALMVWSFAFPVLLLAVPGMPKYDGIRLMLPAYPFLAALAAVGVALAWERLKDRFKRPRRAAQRMAALATFWLLVPVLLFHPFQLCYYGELIGGPWGAKALGLETTYWNETLNGRALGYLNGNVPKGGRVALVNVGSMVWQFYPMTGAVREDIRLGDFGKGDWDFLVIIPRQGMLTPEIKQFMLRHEPVWTTGLAPFNAPPVCLIYRRAGLGEEG